MAGVGEMTVNFTGLKEVKELTAQLLEAMDLLCAINAEWESDTFMASRYFDSKTRNRTSALIDRVKKSTEEALREPDTTEVDIVFDGPPSPRDTRFVEVERTSDRKCMDVGEWVQRDDGYWALRMRITAGSINGIGGSLPREPEAPRGCMC